MYIYKKNGKHFVTLFVLAGKDSQAILSLHA